MSAFFKLSEKEGVNKTRDADPFTLQFQFKTWMYNNKEKNVEIDNVWDFAKEGVTIDTMDPTNENVNMDWLIQLTSDDNCKLLKEAFEDKTNSSGLDKKALEKYASYGGDRSYAFLFIERFIKNATFYADDGAALLRDPERVVRPCRAQLCPAGAARDHREQRHRAQPPGLRLRAGRLSGGLEFPHHALHRCPQHG